MTPPKMTDGFVVDDSDRLGLVSGACIEMDQESDIVSLRPQRLVDYVGQPEIVETLSIAIEAASMRSEPLDHVH